VSEHIVHTTDSSFEDDVIKADRPVLLDFWAGWCGPCKAIAPALESIADEYEGRLRVVKLDVDENPQTAQKYNIRSIPTLLLFRDGTVAAQKIGVVRKPDLNSFLDEHIGSEPTAG